MKRFLTFMCVLSLWAFPAVAGDENVDSFQKVWETIRDKHWALESTGLDWNEVHNRYLPLVEEAGSKEKVRELINQMLDELGQSHFQILGGDAFKSLESLEERLRPGSGSLGFEVQAIDSHLFVIRVDEEGPAAKAGITIGTEILTVDDVPTDEMVAKVRKAFEQGQHAELYINRTLNGYLSRIPGKEVSLKINTPAGPKSLSLTAEMRKGQYLEMPGFGQVFFSYESKVLPGNIGYVRFNMFVLEAKTRFDKDMAGKFADTDGLILDLRGNPGGLGIISVSIANRLLGEQTKLGSMSNQGGTMHFAVFPQKPIFQKPVAVLIDGGSASTSEILAGGLQDHKRAQVFGSTSAGAALPSLVVELPNGDRFQYAMADYISFSGNRLEGVGVVPDVVTPITIQALKQKKDPALAAASQWIQKLNSRNQ